MKTKFQILLILILSLCQGIELNAQNGQVVIYGQVATVVHCESEIGIIGFDHENNSHLSSITTPDSSGQFQLTITLPHQRDIYLHYADHRIGILAAPGDSIFIEIKGINCDDLQFIVDPEKDINRYLDKRYNSDGKFLNSFSAADSLQPLQYLAYRKESLDKQLQEVRSNDYNENLVHWIETNEMVEFGSELLQYLNYYTILGNELLENEKKIYQRELRNLYHSIKYRGKISSSYFNFLYQYFATFVFPVNNLSPDMGKGNMVKALIENANQISDKYGYSFLMSNLLSALISSGEFEEEYILKKVKLIPEEYFKNLTQKKLIEFKFNTEISTDSVSINFLDFTDEIGSTSFLETLRRKYKGKVIYLDIWATWCGSCISNFPYTKALSKEYDPNKFQVIYIGVRSKKETWKKVVKNSKITGDQYLLSDKLYQEIKNALQVEALPHYSIINSDGSIYQRKSSSPSDESLKKLINDLIND